MCPAASCGRYSIQRKLLDANDAHMSVMEPMKGGCAPRLLQSPDVRLLAPQQPSAWVQMSCMTCSSPASTACQVSAPAQHLLWWVATPAEASCAGTYVQQIWHCSRQACCRWRIQHTARADLVSTNLLMHVSPNLLPGRPHHS